MRFRLLLILAFGLFFFIEATAQTTGDYRTRVAAVTWTTDGSWERFNGATWVTVTIEGYPGELATVGTVTIQTGHTATIGAAPPFSIGNLTLQGSGILTHNAAFTFAITGNLTMDGTSQITGTAATRVLTVGGTFSVLGTATNARIGGVTLNVNGAGPHTNAGTLTFNSNTGVKTFVGAVTNSGSWTSTTIGTAANLVFRNGVSSSGLTFAAGGATFNTTAAQSIGGSAAMSFTDVAIPTGITVTNSNTNTVTISSTLTGLGTFTQGATVNTLVFGGTVIGITNFNANGANNTVNYNGGAATTIREVNYHHLIYSGNSTGSISTGITIAGDLSISNAGVFNINGAITVAVTGNLTMNGTSQITGTAATRVLNVGGTFSVLGTATNARIGGVTLNVNGVGPHTNSGTLTFNSNTGVKTFVGAVTNSGTWTSTTLATPGNLVFQNGIDNSGTSFSAGGATFNTNPQAITGTTATSFASGVAITGIVLTYSNTNNFTVTGTTTITGAGGFTDTDDSGIDTFVGNVSLTGTSTFTTTDVTTTGNLVFRGGIANSGTSFSAGGATFNTNAQAIGGTQPLSFANDVASAIALTATAPVEFNGAATQTISGLGTFSFTNLTLPASGALHVNVTTNMTINGILDFTAANTRLLVVDANSNITLGTAATIANFDSDSYVQLDGATGSNSNLIKTSGNNTTDWVMIFPVGTSTGGYTPVDVPTIGTAPIANSTLSVKPFLNPDQTGLLKRSFRLVVAGNANLTTFSNAVFSYNDATDISSGDVEADYTTTWRFESGSSWATVASTIDTGANTFTVTGGSTATASLTTGMYYFTIGALDAHRSWYSYQTGNYSDFNTWTLDPSGSTFDNVNSLIPVTGDEIRILNGFIVTVDVSNQTLATTTIDGGGTLDMSTTTGHDLGLVAGTGLLRVNGSSLPAGTYTEFVSTIGGTIEYYDVGGNLSTTQTTYNILKMTNSTGGNITYVLGSNLTVNGIFEITATGAGTVTWQINDGTANRRTITLNDDLTVSANGRIRASSSGVTGPHLLSIYGDLTNNGSIKFFDDTDTQLEEADYTSQAIYTNALKNNAVNVTFSGVTDQLLTCNNQTDFYRLIVDKGTGQQAMLTVNSSSAANFRLFGPNNQDLSGAAPNYTSDNNLSIVNGTLQLTGTITIPSLVVSGGGGAGGGWPIPQNGVLWLNSPDVSITTTNTTDTGDNGRQVYVFGILRVSAGTITTGYSRGILGGGSGTITIEGGTVNTWQLRTTYLGSNNRFAYNQSGGTVNIGTTGLTGVVENNYPRFALPYAECSFVMSGGTINVATPTAAGTSITGGILIFASAANIQVTGGTVNAICPASGTNFTINTTAPFYDLNVSKAGAGASVAIINSLSFSDGTIYARAAQPLTILNNLTILTGNTPTLNCNGNNLSVAGNLDVQASTTFTSGTNTITFNGTSAQAWTNDGTITANLNNVVVNKTGTLTLGGANAFPNITGGLTLTSGTLADGGKTITVSGTGTLTNNATHSGSGVINYTSTAAAIGGSNGTFGNLTINPSVTGTIAISGNQTVTGTLRLIGASTSLNIASNALTVSGNIYNDASPGTAVSFTSTNRILTSGFHNAGGLTRQGAAGDLLFPVGSSAIGPNPTVPYTPITINVTATGHGTITVRAVNSEHPNVTTTNQSLVYYWRVTSTGYTGVTAVAHKTYTFSTATKNGTITAYRSARFDGSNFTWATNNTTYDATGTTVIPDFSTGTSWTGVTGDQLDGEYTCGNTAAFGTVTVYYSKASGLWNATTTWSNTGHAGVDAPVAPPCATCPVVIGDAATFNHTVTIDADSRSCGTLAINTGSTLDCSTFASLNFGTNTGGVVSGRGTLRVAGAAFPAGDFTNFLGASGGTVEWYGTTKTIPTTGPAPQSLSLSSYYDLVINPSAANTITLPASNLTIYNSLVQGNAAGFTGNVLTNGSRTISITSDLTISRGTFNFSNANPSVTTLTVGGNITISNGATMAALSGGAANINTLSTPGSITNDGTINFRNTAVVNVTFTGTNDVTFGGTGSGGTTLNQVTINKGSSQTPAVDFSVGGTVTTTAAATGWLTMTNGTFNFNNAGTYTLSTNSYTIPSTAKLKVNAGTVNIMTNSNDANDLFLTGALEVSGGTVNVGNTTVDASNSDIEYAAAGTPTVTVSGSGTLYVKSSIRRSILSLAGALVYNQTGGTVTVAGIDSNNTRGVFEIDANTGSSFTLTGTSVLNVQRRTGGTGYADLFINPLTSNVAATSTITMGLSTATTQADLRINVDPTIGNFTIQNGAGTNAQSVNMFSNPLVLGGTLTIPTPSVLNTNSLDVTIAGDLNCPGTYTGGTNTTTFNGTGAQAGTLSGTSTFNNMTVSKTAGTTLTLSGTSPTLQNLNILTGILDVGPLALAVSKNIVINSSQVGAGSILISSTTANSNSITSSGGSFTNLTLGGTATTKTVSVSGDLTINGTLNFSVANRFLMMGSNLLTFGESATAATGVGSTAFVKTNGVTSDLGVTKEWAAGTSTFAFPIGTSFNYTPVSYSLNVTTPGTLNVIPINSIHPTYNQLSGERILNYYWIVTRGSTLAATASANHTYNYPSALITGTGGALVAGYLDELSDPLGWTTSGHGGSATTTQMDFTSTPTTNLPAPGFSYDYSMGTVNTLPNPILPLYSRLGNANVANINVGGDWNVLASWTPDADGDPNGDDITSVLPTGVPVVILSGARINTAVNGRKAYRTTISGLLDNGTKTGHNLGILSGTGTFRSATNTFPAGNYTAFVAAGGGTIEYVAPMTMNNRTTYNNVSIYSSSAGTVTMTASDLILNGNLTIPVGTTLNNANNRDITIAGNWTNAGTYTQGTGTVTFNGSGAQTISGANTFTGLTISKSADNVTLSGAGSTTVTGNLNLTTGNIVSSATNTLALGSSTVSGGSASSYISGPMTKTIAGSASFTAPLGSVAASLYRPATIANTSGSDTWSFEYVGNDPSINGYSNQTINTANLGSVSSYEYWLISRAGATTADLTLSYGTGSYDPPDIGVVANLRVARWDGAQWDLPPGGGVHSQSGTNVTGTITVTNVTNFSPVANASLDDPSPLPVELLSFTGKVVPRGIELHWKTATEINNDHFDVEKFINKEKFVSIGKVKGNGTTTVLSQYSFVDEYPSQGRSYYRLKQTDSDGTFTYSNVISIDYEGPDAITISMYPNPAKGDEITLEIKGFKDIISVPISIHDPLGRQFLADDLQVDALTGSVKRIISIKEMANGMYILKVGNAVSQVSRIIIAR